MRNVSVECTRKNRFISIVQPCVWGPRLLVARENDERCQRINKVDKENSTSVHFRRLPSRRGSWSFDKRALARLICNIIARRQPLTRGRTMTSSEPELTRECREFLVRGSCVQVGSTRGEPIRAYWLELFDVDRSTRGQHRWHRYFILSHRARYQSAARSLARNAQNWSGYF